ncbi:hypothetical protein F511_44600 [Dorcoceras hygrometricum]|uniref:Uncharacterized protein n=1 Tax=Dorcoceras hygrometricum TaxID=472368 RepID=A0A2Z7A595_9LAMI|nr:hypothetical protein F511_44600 [Dorcoceras hygrometricum]
MAVSGLDVRPHGITLRGWATRFRCVVREVWCSVGAMVGSYGTVWTLGWSSRRGSGQGGRSREVDAGFVTAGRGCVEDDFKISGPMDPEVRSGEVAVAYGSREHPEPLDSLGLNGAGDDPVDELIPTGGDDL